MWLTRAHPNDCWGCLICWLLCLVLLMSTWLAPGIASLGSQEIHPLIIHALSVGHWAGDGIGQRFQQKGLIVHNLFQINNSFMLAYFLFLLLRGLSMHSLLLFHTWSHIGLTQGGTLGRYLPIGWDSHETWIGIKVMFKLFISYFLKRHNPPFAESTPTNNKHKT